MTTLAAPPDVNVAVDRDVPCIGCGYNLRGGACEGRCPECGRDVVDSLDLRRLAFADRAWVAKLVRGLDVMLGGVVFGGVMLALLIAVGAAMLLQPPVAEVVAWAFAMPPGLVIAYGCWLLTTREPNAEHGFEDAVRQAARVCVVVLVGLAFATPVALLAHEAAGVACVLLGMAAATIAGFAALSYGRSLARRIPHRKLDRWTLRLQLWLALMTAGAFAGGGLVAAVSGQRLINAGGSDLLEISLVVSMVLGVVLEFVGLGVAAVWTLAMFIAYRFALASVLRAGRS